MPVLPFAPSHRSLHRSGLLLLVGLASALASCQPERAQTAQGATPPVGHYEGSLRVTGQPELRVALDIRHPSPGHYEAEFLAPGTLSFVADTILFSDNLLRLRRPARPGQTLALTLEGDFWRGTLTSDSTKATTILVKRGAPTPSTYRVEEMPQASGSAWLFAPADSSTPGPALALLPTAATAPAAALWADALAREGIIVLLLPAVDSLDGPAENVRRQQALQLLRDTPGTDTATVGIWAVGPRATLLAQALTAHPEQGLHFLIVQTVGASPPERAAWRELRNRKLPVLALHGGPAATAPAAAAMRQALGTRNGNAVRFYRAAGPDLLLPGRLGSQFAPGLPGEVVEWLRSR